MLIEIPDTFEVPLGRAGKYGHLAVDRTKFTAEVALHIWNYGERQLLNDAIATKTDEDGNELTDRELHAKATKRLDTLYSGELRVASDREPTDPVESIMHRLAKSAIAAQIKETPEYKAIKPAKGHDRVLAAIRVRQNNVEFTWDMAVAKYVAAVPALRKQAETIVKTTKAAPAIEL